MFRFAIIYSDFFNRSIKYKYCNILSFDFDYLHQMRDLRHINKSFTEIKTTPLIVKTKYKCCLLSKALVRNLDDYNLCC